MATVKREGSARDFALFGLMYAYGLRATEVTLLELEDVDLSERRIRVRRLKGGDSREYPLEPTPLIGALRRYLRSRVDRGPFLFTGRESNNQRGLRKLQVQRLFKGYARAAGLSPSVACHSLRHTTAVHLLAAGMTLQYVGAWLGHKSLKSTAIYAKIIDAVLENQFRAAIKTRHWVVWA